MTFLRDKRHDQDQLCLPSSVAQMSRPFLVLIPMSNTGRVILGGACHSIYGTYIDLFMIFRSTTRLTNIVPPSHREAPFPSFLELPGKGFLTSVGWVFASDSIKIWGGNKHAEVWLFRWMGSTGRRQLMCGLSDPRQSKLAVLEKSLKGFTAIQTSWWLVWTWYHAARTWSPITSRSKTSRCLTHYMWNFDWSWGNTLHGWRQWAAALSS